MFIVDTSVAVKWFFDDEKGIDRADSVLKGLIHFPENFMVPELFFLELAAVIQKKAKDSEYSQDCLEKIYQLGIRVLPYGRETLQAAIHLANQYSLSVYDGVFVATAKFFDARWLTADEKALKLLPSSLGVSLQDFDLSDA